MQVQTSVLYHRIRVTLDSVQLSMGNSASSLTPDSAMILRPCRCIAHLDLHRASGDALLPSTKALVELDRVLVQLNPHSVSAMNHFLLQTESAADDEVALPHEAQQKVQPSPKQICFGTLSKAQALSLLLSCASADCSSLQFNAADGMCRECLLKRSTSQLAWSQ